MAKIPLCFIYSVIVLIITLPVHPSRAAVTSRSQRSATTNGAVDGMDFRKTHRAAIGVSGAGPLGMGGVNLELNFVPDVGIVTGFGGGPGYQAFNLEIKKILGGRSMLPYVAGGFARWSSFKQPEQATRESNPRFLQTKFLNERQKEAGIFQENLLYPAIGAQYIQLSGPAAGSSVFLEAQMLIDIGDLVAAPAGSIGYLYYF